MTFSFICAPLFKCNPCRDRSLSRARGNPFWRSAGRPSYSTLGRSVQLSAQAPVEAWDGARVDTEKVLQLIKFNEQGLVAGVAQQYDTGEVLMLAWMNAAAVAETLRSGRAVYYSRSRKELWRKGDTSGQVQILKDFRVDCDGDAVLVMVDQKGVACHTGRRACFYRAVSYPSGEMKEVHRVLVRPEELYEKNPDKRRK